MDTHIPVQGAREGVFFTSAVLHGVEDIRIEKRSLTRLGPHEVLLKVMATGLCGSDLHYFQHGRNGDFSLAHPMCLGHEAAGQIIRLGESLSESGCTFEIGDKVIIEPGQACKSCSYCLEGRYNLCPKMRFASSAKTIPHLDGTLQQYIAWPFYLCHLLPPETPYEVGALAEPLAVVLQSFQRTRFIPKQSVLVMGAGAVGLLACAAAKAEGATFVAAVDIDSNRLDFGKANGWVDETFCLVRDNYEQQQKSSNPQQEENKEKIRNDEQKAKAILQSFAQITTIDQLGKGFDVVYECTGVPSCINVSIFSCKAGGKVGLIGMGNPIVTLALGAAALREVDIIGVFRYANMFEKAINMLCSPSFRQNEKGGKIESIFSHRFTLSDSKEAFKTLAKGQSGDGKKVIKILITSATEET